MLGVLDLRFRGRGLLSTFWMLGRPARLLGSDIQIPPGRVIRVSAPGYLYVHKRYLGVVPVRPDPSMSPERSPEAGTVFSGLLSPPSERAVGLGRKCFRFGWGILPGRHHLPLFFSGCVR